MISESFNENCCIHISVAHKTVQEKADIQIK